MVGFNAYVKWSLSLFVNNKHLMRMAVSYLLDFCESFLMSYQLMQLGISIHVTWIALWT